METFRTASSILTERIDVDYYRPIYISNQVKLDALETIRFQELYVKSGIGHTASVEHHYSTNEVGIPFISGKVIKDSQLVLESAKNILTESHFGEMLKSRIKSGYILIVRKGDVGNACIVPVTSGEMNCSSEVMFFECSNLTESYYLSAFFNAVHGELIIKRLQRGSLIPGVSLYDIPDLTIAYPHEKVRIYIGDKVRQAERLRDRSRYWEKRIKILVTSEEIKISLDVKKQKWNTPIIKDLEPRLDAKYYNYQAMQVLKTCQLNSISIRELSPDVSNGFEHRQFVEQGRPYITVTDVSSGRLNIIDVPRIPLSVSIPEKAKVDRCCVLVVRTGSVGTAIKVHSEDEDASISSHLIRLKFKEEMVASAVAAFLNAEAGCCLLHKISYGAVQPQVGQEEVLSLPIPSFILNCASDILHCMNLQEKCIRSAERLTNAAKRLVEALIEGKLSEAELKAAQEGLEKGDTTLDREIISRLTRKGIDNPNEPPLFPDLDALYTALASLDETTEVVAPSNIQTAKVYDFPKPYLALASEDRATYQVAAEVPE